MLTRGFVLDVCRINLSLEWISTCIWWKNWSSVDLFLLRNLSPYRNGLCLFGNESRNLIYNLPILYLILLNREGSCYWRSLISHEIDALSFPLISKYNCGSSKEQDYSGFQQPPSMSCRIYADNVFMDEPMSLLIYIPQDFFSDNGKVII